MKVRSFFQRCFYTVLPLMLAGCTAQVMTPAPAATPTIAPTSTAAATQAITETAPAANAMPAINPSGNVTVFATGLNSPRGLKFGPDGALYVAEGGTGGTTTTTAADCEQVPAPVGPYSGGMTGRISKIDASGNITTVVDNLPSSQTNAESGGLTSGVADVAFISDTLYALVTGAGCSHGLKGTTNGVYAIGAGGAITEVADLSAFYMSHPTAQMNKADFEPDGTPYSMMAVDGNLYVIEPNHGSLEKVTKSGEITRVIDISASAGHIVPTSMAYNNDNFYIGNLSVYPVPANSAVIMEVTPAGEVQHITSGLTAETGVAFDAQGRLYALETTTVNGQLPVPGTGKLVRVDPASGTIEEIATGLAFPTGMTFGPDGTLYVSNYGFGFPPGSGQVVKITIPD